MYIGISTSILVDFRCFFSVREASYPERSRTNVYRTTARVCTGHIYTVFHARHSVAMNAEITVKGKGLK